MQEMEALLYKARTATQQLWLDGRSGAIREHPLVDIARTAEEGGFDRIAVTDHVWQHPIVAV